MAATAAATRDSMLFCDPEYYDSLRPILSAPSPPNVWEVMSALCRCAVEHDSWRLAAFFLPVDFRREYVLGPHWGMKAPFIRLSYSSLADSGRIAGPVADGSQEGVHLLPLKLRGGQKALFYGIADNAELTGAEAGCAEKLFEEINLQFPELSSE